MRSVHTQGVVGVRSVFQNDAEDTLSYLFPAMHSPGLVVDGRDLKAGEIMVRQPGDTPYFRTSGSQELGVLILTRELLRTLAALSGRDRFRALIAPARADRIDPARQLQTRSMARIERFIDEGRGHLSSSATCAR